MANKKPYLAKYLSSEKEVACVKCKATVKESALAENDFICPVCEKYNRVPARVRIEMLADAGSFREIGGERVSQDLISFPEYVEKLETSKAKSGENEAVITGECKIDGEKCCLFVMESAFMMGSMGTVVGDKLAALFEYAIEKKLPVVGYTVSGGARMQEGMLSLMQMAKVSGAAKLHSDAGNFYLVCATDPTTGGVTASFAMLGDVIISEPGALIGFAGKRVIEQTTGEKLPPEFQSAEFQLKNGFLDAVVERREHPAYIGNLLRIHAR